MIGDGVTARPLRVRENAQPGALASPPALAATAPRPRIGLGAIARRAPAWTITAALGLVYVLAAPASADLAAAGYRSDLFGRAGFTLWDNGWYGGHHLLAYSVLAPALGWLLGPLVVAAVSMTVAAALFERLIEGRFPARAGRVAGAWFALGAGVGLLSGRVPFDLGLAIGLGALLCAQRDRRAPALLLAPLSGLASPVAGAFLALAAVAWALADLWAVARPPSSRSAIPTRAPAPGARRPAPGRDGSPSPHWPFALALALATLAPTALLALAFPEGGSQPFVSSSALPALAGVLIIAALIPAGERMLRIGALLYAALLLGTYLLPTPLGGNADRLGALFAGPIAACMLIAGNPGDERPRWRLLALLVLAPFLFYWQVNAPTADYSAAASDPSVEASYYAPLLGELETLGVTDRARPARVEVVATANHWEARWVAPRVSIARGWERQLDREHNALFYESGPLSSTSYHSWLLEQAIAYVALPDARLDHSAESEARLVTNSCPGAGERPGAARRPSVACAGGYLREIWRSEHWRLFAVLGARPLAQPPAVMRRLGSDSFTLDVPRAGTFTVRVRFTPYWTIASGHGCVRQAPGDWTEIQARASGSVRVAIDFSLARVFEDGPRCS